MPTVKVVDLTHKEVGEIELAEAVFGVALNEPLIHEAVRSFMANRRAGTSATKTRGDVSGSGRKLWKQKGTGRARIASLRSPLWKGGGNAHGPQPRDWSYNLPKKMRKRAMCSAISARLREGNLVIVDEWKFDQAKTKEFINTLGSLNLTGKTLIVDSLKNTKLMLASRNVQTAKVVNSYGVNIYDLVNHQKLVLTPRTVEELTGILQPRARDDEESSQARSDEGESESGQTAATSIEEQRSCGVSNANCLGRYQSPVITEKALVAKEETQDRRQLLTFRVDRRATKPEIKNAVESIFQVKVHHVRTANYLGKMARRGRHEGRKPSWKKAYVTLKQGEKPVDYGEAI